MRLQYRARGGGGGVPPGKGWRRSACAAEAKAAVRGGAVCGFGRAGPASAQGQSQGRGGKRGEGEGTAAGGHIVGSVVPLCKERAYGTEEKGGEEPRGAQQDPCKRADHLPSRGTRAPTVRPDGAREMPRAAQAARRARWAALRRLQRAHAVGQRQRRTGRRAHCHRPGGRLGGSSPGPGRSRVRVRSQRCSSWRREKPVIISQYMSCASSPAVQSLVPPCHASSSMPAGRAARMGVGTLVSTSDAGRGAACLCPPTPAALSARGAVALGHRRESGKQRAAAQQQAPRGLPPPQLAGARAFGDASPTLPPAAVQPKPLKVPSPSPPPPTHTTAAG